MVIAVIPDNRGGVDPDRADLVMLTAVDRVDRAGAQIAPDERVDLRWTATGADNKECVDVEICPKVITDVLNDVRCPCLLKDPFARFLFFARIVPERFRSGQYRSKIE